MLQERRLPIQAQTTIQQRRAFSGFGATGNDILSRHNAPRDFDLLAMRRCVLDHDDCIRTGRDWSPGHDGNALSHSDIGRNPVERRARFNLPDHIEHRR